MANYEILASKGIEINLKPSKGDITPKRMIEQIPESPWEREWREYEEQHMERPIEIIKNKE